MDLQRERNKCHTLQPPYTDENMKGKAAGRFSALLIFFTNFTQATLGETEVPGLIWY